MHAVGDHGGPGVPAFLTKLWTLVEDPSTDELICWDPTGRSFHVYEQARFSKEVLPMYFKHSNIASFIRQLNMYGFRKVVNVEAGGLKTERDDMEFAHQCFVRDQENLLEYIKRKVPSGKADEVKLKPGDLTHVLTDVHDLKDKQSSMTNKIGALKVENEALWREVATLRNKHHKQQQIVNKLIQFLVSLVGNRGISSRKRTMPLMIDDAPNSKAPKLAGQNTREEVPKTATSTETEDKSGGCLTIHDITDLPDVSGGTGDANNIQAFAQQQNINMADLVSGMAQVPDETVQQANVPEVPVDIISLIDAIPSQGASNVGLDLTSLVTQEGSAASTSAATYSAPPTSDPQSSVAVAVPSGCNSSRAALKVDVTLKPTNPAIVPMSPSRSELGDHVDNLQADLEAIKDLLTAGTYSLDPSQLLELFASEPHNTLPPDIFNVSGQDLSNLESSFPAQGSSGNISGNELIQYTAPTEMGPIFEFDDELPGGEDSKLNTPHPDLGEVKKELTEEVD